MTLDSASLDSVSQCAEWAAILARIAGGTLAYCPDFPAIAARHEAFWSCQVTDRPLFLGSANKSPERAITRRLELLHDPDAWFAAKLEDLEQTHVVGDTLPTVRVDLGPVSLGGFFGARLEFGADTSWTHAFIDDNWLNAPQWTIAPDNPYWRTMETLAERVAADAVGRYVVMIPNLGGTADVLLNLRGSSGLAIDVIEQPDTVLRHVDAIFTGWRQAYVRLHEMIVGAGAGITEYLGLWSNRPYVLPQCDFSAMIGPRPFKRLFLPDIARQSAAVGRAIFHLDGPDATRHIDSLLDTPEINAIQYVVGAGHSALPHISMFQKVQSRGKPLQVLCPFGDVLAVCEALQPEGLAILVDEVPSAAALDELYAQFCARYA